MWDEWASVGPGSMQTRKLRKKQREKKEGLRNWGGSEVQRSRDRDNWKGKERQTAKELYQWGFTCHSGVVLLTDSILVPLPNALL